MSSDPQNAPNKGVNSRDSEYRSRDSSVLTWPLLRRLETAAFLAMFIAVPVFAFRVVDYTARQLALNNSAHELVKDIRRVKEMATQFDMPITVESHRSSETGQGSYVIRSPKKTIEEVILPKGVTMVGEVTFGEDGSPKQPSTFDVSLENRSLTVNIDKTGVASMR